MRDTHHRVSSTHTSTLPPAPQEQVGVSVRRCPQEDELICSDLNARSSLWDQHSTTSRGVHWRKRLTTSPSFLCQQQPPHISVCDRVTQTVNRPGTGVPMTPWARAQTLASHGCDHLPVVFSEQKPANEPRLKPIYPSRVGCQSCELVSQITQQSRHPTTLVVEGNPGSMD